MQTKYRTRSWSPKKCCGTAELEGTYLGSHFMTEGEDSHSGRVMVSGRAEGRSWRQASRSSVQASEPGPRTGDQVLNPGLCVTCPR